MRTIRCLMWEVLSSWKGSLAGEVEMLGAGDLATGGVRSGRWEVVVGARETRRPRDAAQAYEDDHRLTQLSLVRLRGGSQWAKT